ncbi:Alpha/Beta hydrolase protein [Colletotrichum cereale]|nr:Alpha/Beta hydrolase protein [Colletotrichum cereale]
MAQYESSIPGRATVVLIHGGGFAVGHPTHVSHYARAAAKLFGITVFSITYRLTPHYRFPTYHAALGEYNKAAFILGGISAGGNLAAKWISDKRTPILKGVWLGVPWIMEREHVPSKYRDLWVSREQNSASFVLNASTISSILATYQPDFLSPDFSPFNSANLHQVCGQDPLRDDGLIYEKILRDHGVLTKIDVYLGVPHGFADLFPGFSLILEYLKDSMKGFGWLYGVEISDVEIAKAYAPVS